MTYIDLHTSWGAVYVISARDLAYWLLVALALYGLIRWVTK